MQRALMHPLPHPTQPILTLTPTLTLPGAVGFGVRPELVRARRARMTYGVRACAPFDDGAPGKFWHEVRALVLLGRCAGTAGS